jgi:hypothetical protein
VRALDRAISEVIETGPEAQAAAGPGRARTLALEERPPPPVPPRSAGPQAEEDAPVSLGHSGIMVAIPDQPIEEVQAGAARPAQPQARARRAHSHPPTNELAPISRPPPKVKGGQGSALREQQTSRPNWMVYALIGGVGLAVVVVAVIVIISLVTK